MTHHEADENTYKREAEVEAAPARRRRYSPKYKRQVLDKLESMTPAERGAYLRKEGLYSSMVYRWKQKLDGTRPDAPAVQSGGNVDRGTDVRQLKRQLEQAERKLKKAEAVIDLQKKALSLLDLLEENR